jgi:brefeldin A-inhibited guanine nucleotide-exchange protein
MLTQETQSVACVLRIALKAICDESRRVHWAHAQNVASNVINDSLQYYLSLNNPYHQTSWNPILLLIFTKLYKLPEDKVRKNYFMVVFSFIITVVIDLLQFAVQSSQHYSLLCEMISIDLKPELKTVLSWIFSRIGPVFKIT